mmetsp:Transcript_31656/g.77611  ORF Transcript_31656/g.77611 Transcript_31656/m.77611 type:complete len:583 (+) Transcript_31656:222-1970(+)
MVNHVHKGAGAHGIEQVNACTTSKLRLAGMCVSFVFAVLVVVLLLVKAGVVDAEKVGPEDHHRHGLALLFTEPLAQPQRRIYPYILLCVPVSLLVAWTIGCQMRPAIFLHAVVAFFICGLGETGNNIAVLFPGGGWCSVPSTRLSLIRSRMVIINDGDCSMVPSLGGVDRGLLSKKSGGEFLFCENVILLASAAGYVVSVMNNVQSLARLVGDLERASRPPLVILHNGAEHLPGINLTGPGLATLPPPFRTECFAKLGFWGPGTVKTSAAENYIMPFPMPPHSHSGVRSDLCRRTHGMRPNMIQADQEILSSSPFAILYGKFSAMKKPDMVHVWLRNGSLWDNMVARVRIIVTHCHPTLAVALRHSLDSFVCLDPESALRGPNFADLLGSAEFVLGGGHPILSPTPLEALSCNTSVILPRGQHSFLETVGRKPAFYAVDNADELLAAVDEVLSMRAAGRKEAVGRVSDTVLRANDATDGDLQRSFAGVLNNISRACTDGSGAWPRTYINNLACGDLQDSGSLDHLLLLLGVDFGGDGGVMAEVLFCWVAFCAVCALGTKRVRMLRIWLLGCRDASARRGRTA